MLQQDFIDELVQKYDLDLLILFGSRAKDRAREDSDIDVAYLSKKPLSDEQWDEMMCSIMANTHINRVDLVNLNHEHGLLIRYQIFTTGKLLYESAPRLFREMMFTAINQYSDARPVLADFVEKNIKQYLQSFSHA